jgi:hypothetical protein
VAKDEREQIGARSKEVHKGRQQRQKLEAEVGDRPSVEPKAVTRPVKVKLPKSAIVAQSADKLDKDDAPPKSTAAPEADIKIEPKARKPRGNGKIPIVEPKETGDKPRPERPVTERKPPKVEAKPPMPEMKPDKPPKVEVKKPQVDAKPPKVHAKPPQAESKRRRPKDEPKGLPKDGGKKDKPRNEK